MKKKNTNLKNIIILKNKYINKIFKKKKKKKKLKKKKKKKILLKILYII